MKEIMRTVTQKGQVTIPFEIRNLLGLKTRDKVIFKIDNDNIRLTSAKYTLETAYGAVKPLNNVEDFKKLKQIAIEEHVEKVIKEMKR
jgi:AbrB family looped-hinge helix DNA binding protein